MKSRGKGREHENVREKEVWFQRKRAGKEQKWSLQFRTEPRWACSWWARADGTRGPGGERGGPTGSGDRARPAEQPGRRGAGRAGGEERSGGLELWERRRGKPREGEGSGVREARALTAHVSARSRRSGLRSEARQSRQENKLKFSTSNNRAPRRPAPQRKRKPKVKRSRWQCTW